MRIQIPNDPERWNQDASARPPGAGVLLRGARRPRPPGSTDLARLRTAIDDIPRRSARATRRWTRLSSAVAGMATLFALGTGVWAWRGQQRARVETAPAVAPEPVTPARAVPPRRIGIPSAAPIIHEPAHAHAAAAHARRAVAVAHANKPAAVAPIAATPPAGDPLPREIALIDAAREQLTSAPARALAAIEAHRRDFPAGQLTAEREFLAVEALRRLNRMDEAWLRAAALGTRYPSSSYAARASRALSAP